MRSVAWNRAAQPIVRLHREERVYRPSAFQINDEAWCLGLVEDHGFGHLVSAGDGPLDPPMISPVPMLIRDGTLMGHVARANPHWKLFGGARVAQAIFSGPHAYVSPTWMPTPARSVPTWNYVQVRAVGRPRVLDDPGRVMDMMRDLAAQYERGGDDENPGWSPDTAEPDFITGMMRGIVAFEMPIDGLEGKAKLSQNKPAETVAAVATRLAATGHGDLAKMMRESG